MRTKGFTLIELLAVIVILAIIALIAVPIILNIIKESKATSNERSIELYGKAVENAIGSYQVTHPEDNEITLDKIKKYIKYSGNEVECNITINKDGTVYLKECKVDKKEVEYTYGKEVKQICTLVEGESQKVGSKYTCTLDEPRTFYVLETTDEEVSLLMEQNFTDGDGTNGTIPPTVAWCTDGGDKNTCKNINTTGSEAPEGKDYIGHITEVFNTTGVTVSFPTKGQIVGAYTGTMPQWIYDYLKGRPNPVPDVLGYWTASPYADSSSYAWDVYYYGVVSSSTVSGVGFYGLRPVITISKSSLN